ncbi:MAG: hypothetical protein FJZ58_04015 [Chlamydiae bacterium]|nr:hypothetical protein [Chlamydiota bacterium]
MFSKYKIWQTNYRDKQGKYPVIFLTLKEIKSSTWKESFEALKLLIIEEFERHQYLLTATFQELLPRGKKRGDQLLSPTERNRYQSILQGTASRALYKNSLQMLIHLLTRHYGQRVYVFIDEYDAPIHAAYLHGYYDSMIEFIRSWLGGGLKDNSHLEQAVISGILRTTKESIFSGLNNFACHTLLGERFSDKFGLLEEEVLSLFQEQGVPCVLEDIRSWYNGYHIGKHALYNPWSILQCLEHGGALQPYWLNTSDNALIKKLLLQGNPSIKKDLEDILLGNCIIKSLGEEVVFSSLLREENAVWTLLFFSGYLTLKGRPSYEDAELVCSLQSPIKRSCAYTPQ